MGSTSSLHDAYHRLGHGEHLELTPRGGSMTGLIEDGDTVRLSPCPTLELAVGDIVLVRVKARIVLHKVVALDTSHDRVRIGNNIGGINGWTGRRHVAGIVTHVNGVPRRGVDIRLTTVGEPTG